MQSGRRRLAAWLLMLAASVGAVQLVPIGVAADPATDRVVASSNLLSEGQQGSLVADLQTALARLGIDPGPIDGIFGPSTDAGVRGFQTTAGISVDGVVGPQTKRAFAEAAAPDPDPPVVADRPVLSPGSSGTAVASLQRELARAGLYRGPIDGDFGPLTASAVVAAHKAWGTERIATWVAGDWDRIGGWQPQAPGYGSADHRLEVDLSRQVLFVVRDATVAALIPVSSGNGAAYTTLSGGSAIARTPTGDFTLVRNVNGWEVSYLGELYEPWYFSGGYALHGSHSVPPYPASHGCIRIPVADADWLDPLLWIGMPIHVRG